MNIPTKQRQTLRHREQACDYQEGAWDQQMQSIIHRVGKQQGPTV